MSRIILYGEMAMMVILLVLFVDDVEWKWKFIDSGFKFAR